MQKILVIGSTVADIHIHLNHLPSFEEDINMYSQKMTVGGCAYNVARMIASLDTPCTLFSPIGKGIYADYIRTQTADKPVKPCIESEEENGCCYCLIDEQGNRTFMSLHGAEYHFQKEWFDRIDIQEYGSIYVCGC